MTAVRAGLDDLLAAWKRRQLAFYFAWSETVARYRRSALGPFWLVIGTAVGVGGLGFVWSTLFQLDMAVFVPQITLGLVVWQFIATSLTEGVTVFTKSANAVHNIRIPSYLLTLQALSRQIINFAHNLVVVVVVFLIFPHPPTPVMLLALPGLLIVIINMFAIMQILGLVGARYRDMEPLVTALVPLLFFISPVIFTARMLGPASVFLEFNPLAHFIRLVRDPILGVAPTPESWLAVAAITVVTVLTSLTLTGARAYRLPYWV